MTPTQPMTLQVESLACYVQRRFAAIPPNVLRLLGWPRGQEAMFALWERQWLEMQIEGLKRASGIRVQFSDTVIRPEPAEVRVTTFGGEVQEDTEILGPPTP